MENINEDAGLVDENGKEVSLFGSLPAFFAGLVLGAILASSLTVKYYEERYGTLLEHVPKWEEEKRLSEERNAEIRNLVDKNEESAKLMEESANAIIGWAEGMKPKIQKVTNQ